MRFRRHQEAAQASTTRLLIAFVGLVVGVVLCVNALLWAAWRLTLPMARELPALFFETNTALVLLFVLGGSWVESLRLREGGAHVAKLAGARPAQPGGGTSAGVLERRFVNVVTEMALAAGTRPPSAWVMARDDRINAFAAGWGAEDAVIAVTRGALERLTRVELQGVVAHEFSHLVHGDARLNMRLIGLVWGLQMVHGLGRRLAAADEQGRRHVGLLFGLALIVVGWVGWLAGRLLQASVSRQREFLADASAVKYTRQVDGIGGALRKIAGAAPLPRPPQLPASLSHLWLSPPAGGLRAAWRGGLATHPPLAERLRRLYGRTVQVWPAEVLPVPAQEPAVPVTAAVPMAPTEADAGAAESPVAPGFAPTQVLPDFTATVVATGFADTAPPSGPAPRRAAAPVADAEATRFDATQHPDRASAAERAREAAQRIAYWHSRGERHAALLALLLAEDGTRAPWRAWEQATAPWRSAAAVRTEVLALGPAGRLQAFETLAQRTAEAGDGSALLHAAAPLAGTDAARLRLWLLRRLARPPRRPLPATAWRPLEALAPAAEAATALLAAVAGWPEATASAGTAPSWRCAWRLRRLHPMQRPRLVRDWLQAAQAAGRAHDLHSVLALVLACRLLDSPVPPALAAALDRVGAP